MKKNYIFLALAVLGWSCKKDSESNPNPTPTSSCLLTEVRDSVGNTLANSYEYDASRRVSKLYSYNGGLKSGYSTFTYSATAITRQEFRMDNSSQGSSLATLNSSGYISLNIGISSDSIDNEPVTTKDTSNFTYNSSGQLSGYSIKAWSRNAAGDIKSQFTQTLTNEYTSGRVSKSTTSLNVGGANPYTLTFTEVFTYDPASPSVKYNPLLGFNEESGEFFGKISSDKLPSKIETTSDFGTSIQTITATVDAKGNPTKIRVAGIDVTTSLYTYNCP